MFVDESHLSSDIKNNSIWVEFTYQEVLLPMAHGLYYRAVINIDCSLWTTFRKTILFPLQTPTDLKAFGLCHCHAQNVALTYYNVLLDSCLK